MSDYTDTLLDPTWNPTTNTVRPVYNPAPSPAHAAARAGWSAADHATQRWAEEATSLAWQEVVHQNLKPMPGREQEASGDPYDQERAQVQWQAAMNSPFKGTFRSPGLVDSMSRKGQRVRPLEGAKLTFLPGAPPDTVMDSVTGDIYTYNSPDDIVYGGNITLPQYHELQRGSAAVLAKLTQQGRIAPVQAKPLPGDHGWKSQTSPQVPGWRTVGRIDPHAPTLEDIATNLSHESGTIWAQVARSTKRAIGIGSVLATALAGAAGPMVGGAVAAGGPATFGSATAAAGASAAAGGLGAFLGQLAGRGGDLGAIDWNHVVRSTLISAAGSAASLGTQALGNVAGVSPGISSFAGRVADKVTSQGIGSVLPKTGQDIRAYQPYPGMSPESSRRIISRVGY
jgi:hypothetical protein